VVVPNTAFVAGKVFNLTNTMLSGPEIEVIEGYFIVDFVPTSENFAKWLYDIVVAKMTPLGVTVKSVEWCETPKTSAIYGKD
jgi:6-pyruvoyltetrahydropterin/6-carboxytetrahydropterin synthase